MSTEQTSTNPFQSRASQKGRHKCFRCESADVASFPGSGKELESIDATGSDSGDEIFFASGYGAREIAQKRAAELKASVYVNNVSRKIRRKDLSVPVAYAVCTSPVYTVLDADEYHDSPYKSYWRPMAP